MSGSVDDLIAKLKLELERDTEIQIFNKDEVTRIRSLIKFVEMMEGWGVLGRYLLWMITAFAGILIAWEQIATKLVGK